MARRSGKTIDYKQWSGLPGINLDSAAAATLAGGSLAFAAPATILRVRGMVMVNQDGATDGATQFVTMGLGIVSTDAVAAGAASLPDPGDEPEYPWLYWLSVPLRSAIISGSTVGDIASSARIELDTKAMRRVKPGQSLVMVYQTTTASAVDINQGQLCVLLGT